MSKEHRAFDLEDRVIEFVVRIIRLAEKEKNFRVRHSLFDIRYSIAFNSGLLVKLGPRPLMRGDEKDYVLWK